MINEAGNIRKIVSSNLFYGPRDDINVLNNFPLRRKCVREVSKKTLVLVTKDLKIVQLRPPDLDVTEVDENASVVI